MKVSIIEHATGNRHAAEVVDNGQHVTIERCPACGACPAKAAGIPGTLGHDHDTYRADAKMICCAARIGTIETRVNTLFGITEDAAVLRGKWRVY